MMKLHEVEKENNDLRDKLRVYNAIIDRYDFGRFLGKTGIWAVPGTRHDKSRVDPGKAEINGWERQNRTAYHSGAPHLKISSYFRV